MQKAASAGQKMFHLRPFLTVHFLKGADHVVHTRLKVKNLDLVLANMNASIAQRGSIAQVL